MLKFIQREINIYLDLECTESHTIPVNFYMYYIKDRDYFNPKKILNTCNTGIEITPSDWFEKERKLGKGNMLTKTIFVIEWWHKKKNTNKVDSKKILYLKDKDYSIVPVDKTFFGIHSRMYQRLHI